MSNGPRTWAGIAVLVGVTLFVSTVATLHFVQPEYEPVHQLMSELALGPFGWAMIIAFAGLALAVFGVQAAVPIGRSWPKEDIQASVDEPIVPKHWIHQALA